MREDTLNSNVMYMVEIENLYASRNDMLISLFKIYFIAIYIHLTTLISVHL